MSNARFSILQARAVSDLRISNAQFRTLAALGMYSDENGWCFPKLKTIGDQLGKSKQAVSRDLQYLAEIGYIEIRPQYREDGSRKNNLYRLKFDLDSDTSQRHVDTHKHDDNTPSTLSVDTPSTLSVDTPSTSEVDALTTHINDPSNDPVNNNGGELFRLYENEIGTITPMISNLIQEWQDNYPDDWPKDAIGAAVRANVRKPSYITAILENWHKNGKQDRRKNQNGQAESYGLVGPNGEIL